MENLDSSTRSIMFAFKARGLEIFTNTDENDRFFLTRLVCSECSAFFHTNLQECYLCGEINYYLLQCTNKTCNDKVSITRGGRMCRKCYPDRDVKTPQTLVYMCVNPDCIYLESTPRDPLQGYGIGNDGHLYNQFVGFDADTLI